MIVRALPYADLLEHDGEALLLTEGTLVRLSGIGAEVLRLAADGIDATRLAEPLEETFGAPASGTTADALVPILDALAAQRLLELVPQEVPR